jgi:uncharacterized 2Fe-2S/4Fe-4S cluster protein (DUF4445 family)
MRGKLTSVTLEEEALFTPAELDEGYRLACQARPLSDVVIDIPPESLTTPQRLQVEGVEAEVPLQPLVQPVDLKLDPPTLDDLRSDTARLRDGISQSFLVEDHTPLRFHYTVLAHLSGNIRQLDWNMRLVKRQHEVIAILPPTTRDGAPTPLLGLAVDVGTTKVAAYLLDLSSGRTIAKTGAMNPQIAFGEDVVSRIVRANAHKDGAKVLQSRLVETLNTMVANCAAAQQDGQQLLLS